jgi:hypothetical protein
MQPNGTSRVAEIAYIALILGVAWVVWREASALPPAPYDPLGPKAFPIWVSYGLAALGLAMLTRLLFGRSLGRASQALVVGLADVTGEPPRRPWVAGLVLVLAFAYSAGLFLPATAVYLFLSGLVLGPLRPRRVIGVAMFAIVAAVVLDFLFRTIFKLDLT